MQHVATVEAGYLGDCFGRPFPEPMPWALDDGEENGDFFVDPGTSAAEVAAFYRRVWAHSDATLEVTSLDATGTVWWWPEERRHPTLHRVLVHVCTENDRHLGQVDILREQLDGAVGARSDHPPLLVDAAHVARVQAAADTFH